jgi:hypothetical protein
MKKSLIALMFLVSLSLLCVCHAELEISKVAVKDVVISGLGNQAEFNLVIKNLGPSDTFELYTLVSGIDITPAEKFFIAQNSEKEIELRVTFDDKILKGVESFGFEYRIAGEKSGVTKDILSVQVFTLGSAVVASSDDIQYNQKEAQITVKNRANYTFQAIDVNVKSEFFNAKESVDLKPYETKSFTVNLDQDRLARAISGEYLLSYNVTKGDVSGKGTSIFSFRELTNIKTDEKTTGLLTRTFTSTKLNQGNSKAVVRVYVDKGWFENLFTTTSIKPSDTEKTGGVTTYIFEKELLPDETFTVIVKTRYWIPLLLAIALASAVWLFFIEGRRRITIKKKVVFVKTKGGEFALRVVLYVRALKNIEKVSIIEKIPGIVKIFKKFGIIEPTNIDEKKRHIEWKFDSMNAGEERVLSYIVYSKLGIFGKFELAPAVAIYEHNGQEYETESNKVVFCYEEKKDDYRCERE